MRFRLLSGLAVALGIGHFLAGGSADEPKPALGKGKRAQEFMAAFNKGDAKAVAAFWTPDATYVDEVGHEVKGRPAIEKLYEGVFAQQKGAKLDINVISARLISADVGLEEGITVVTPADGGPASAARFSAVLVKKDGEWYLESVHDAVAHPPTNAEHFENLELLLGDWKGEAEKGESGTASYHWAENRNFIVSTFATTLNGIPVIGGTQWIAWDAVDKQVRSWSFYSGGGVGEAVWTKNDNNWSSKITAKAADGKTITATNVLTITDADHFTTQLTKLTVNGEPIPDPKPLKMKRVKP
jgi:uncharacterized protein (TIGR02246 family)